MSPFTTEPSQSIAHLGETQLIEALRSWLGDASPQAPYGIGDDCAVLPPPTLQTQQLVTADPIIYGKHFDDQISPTQAAAKLLRRNLSDIAAMGGNPKHAVVSLALAPSVSISWIEAFYTALAQEAMAFNTSIVGGDVSSTDDFLGAFLTLYGETYQDLPPLLRHSARPGSPLFVTGALGGTRMRKHHNFTPRLEEGRWLARSGLCLSCSDLSDGIGKDYANLLSPNLRCEIDCSQLPVSNDAKETAQTSGKDPLYHVFNDGEDFELIFALEPNADLERFTEEWKRDLKTPISHIGYTTERPAPDSSKLVLKNAPQPFSASGYEHLR